MSDFKLHTVIVKNKPFDEAYEMAKKIIKRKKFIHRQKSNSFHFRNIPKTKFIKGSFKTKKINPNLSLIFGTLKDNISGGISDDEINDLLLEILQNTQDVKKSVNLIKNRFDIDEVEEHMKPKGGINFKNIKEKMKKIPIKKALSYGLPISYVMYGIYKAIEEGKLLDDEYVPKPNVEPFRFSYGDSKKWRPSNSKGGFGFKDIKEKLKKIPIKKSLAIGLPVAGVAWGVYQDLLNKGILDDTKVYNNSNFK